MCLLGDFNSRTAQERDDLDIDNNDYLIVNNVNNATFVLNKLSLPHIRSYEDTKKNNVGSQLLEFCRCNNCLILNGRVGSDKGIGKLTCKNKSVVDYIIATPKLLNYVADFSVLEFSCLFSDAHCPIMLSLDVNNVDDSTDALNNDNMSPSITKIKPWEMEKSNVFSSNIDVHTKNKLKQTNV